MAKHKTEDKKAKKSAKAKPLPAVIRPEAASDPPSGSFTFSSAFRMSAWARDKVFS